MTTGRRLRGHKTTIARLSVAVALLLVPLCGYLWLRNAPAEHNRDEGAAALRGASRKTASPAAARQRQTRRAAAVLAAASPGSEVLLHKQPSAENGRLEELGPIDDYVDAVVSDDYVDTVVDDYARRRVREAQDRALSQWPRYAQVREQYVRELSSTLDLEHASCDKMIELALAFRQDFWAQGGDLAAHSYPFAYKARALLEQAHQRFPDNLNILDELIETIQSTDLILKFDPVENRDGPNEAVRQELQNLRQQQWAVVQSQRQAGRAPRMQDFLCACDLAYLLQAKNAPASKEVVRWLRDTDDGTWHQYQELLRRWEESLDRGIHFGFGIYETPPDSGSDEHRYGRRLPSFRGPTDRQASFWPAGGMTVIETVETPPRR